MTAPDQTLYRCTPSPLHALLLAGNECLPYTGISPLVQAGVIRTAHCASLSLPSQPRGTARLSDLLAGIIHGGHVGAIGWKWFGPDEVEVPALALDIPAFLADPLRRIAGRVENATDLMMHPAYGLRARVDAAEIARLVARRLLAPLAAQVPAEGPLPTPVFAWVMAASIARSTCASSTCGSGGCGRRPIATTSSTLKAKRTPCSCGITARSRASGPAL